MELVVKLIGLNLTNRQAFTGNIIPVDFFANQEDEIEVESLIVNGVDFGDSISGYKVINQFLADLADLNDPIELEVLKLIADKKICDIKDLISFTQNSLIECTTDSSELGFNTLREIVGERFAFEQMERIQSFLPKKEKDLIDLYFDKESYIDDLYLNNLKFLKSEDQKIQAVVKLKDM